MKIEIEEKDILPLVEAIYKCAYKQARKDVYNPAYGDVVPEYQDHFREKLLNSEPKDWLNARYWFFRT